MEPILFRSTRTRTSLNDDKCAGMKVDCLFCAVWRRTCRRIPAASRSSTTTEHRQSVRFKREVSWVNSLSEPRLESFRFSELLPPFDVTFHSIIGIIMWTIPKPDSLTHQLQEIFHQRIIIFMSFHEETYAAMFHFAFFFSLHCLINNWRSTIVTVSISLHVPINLKAISSWHNFCATFLVTSVTRRFLVEEAHVKVV